MPSPQKPAFNIALSQKVDTLANQCVKCALCLPHCPTYQLTEDENESPRGRIALLQAVAQEALPLDKKLKGHLDRCLGCLACERVCPAHVEYGTLLDTGRSLLNAKNPVLAAQSTGWLLKRFVRYLRSPNRMRVIQWLLWGAQRTGCRRLAHMLGLTRLLGLSRFDKILPKTLQRPQPLQTRLTAFTQKRGTVMLFLGCLTQLCDQETLTATCFVLRHCGYDIVIPPNQTCCGAVNQHAGDTQTAEMLAVQNQQAFASNAEQADAIISLATGCTVVLQSYQSKVVDLVSFLVHRAALPVASLKKQHSAVWIHTPCTRRNTLRETSDPEKLLSNIPGLTCHPIANPNCCGAAGSYMLQFPKDADALADKLLNAIQDQPIDTLVTTNIGCALQLQQRLKALKSPVKVMHPIVLLAKSLSPL